MPGERVRRRLAAIMAAEVVGFSRLMEANGVTTKRFERLEGVADTVPFVPTNPADPRNRRTRASIHVVMDGLHVQVDAPPEFRLQCLREKIRQLDLFILTHGHADHIHRG